MTESVQRAGRPVEADPILDDLLAEFANKLQAGEGVDLEAFVREHAERAEELRRLLPAIQVLAHLEHPSSAAEASLTPRGPDSHTALGELGDFRILREVGRGGMGVVYEAMQISLGRRVALKILPFAAALDARQLQRFKNEAQAAAHLEHPHIVPVYYVGCERGVHFYAMRFIEGHTLAAVIHELHQAAGPKSPAGAAPAHTADALAGELASGRWAPARPNGADPSAPPTMFRPRRLHRPRPRKPLSGRRRPSPPSARPRARRSSPRWRTLGSRRPRRWNTPTV